MTHSTEELQKFKDLPYEEKKEFMTYLPSAVLAKLWVHSYKKGLVTEKEVNELLSDYWELATDPRRQEYETLTESQIKKYKSKYRQLRKQLMRKKLKFSLDFKDKTIL